MAKKYLEFDTDEPINLTTFEDFIKFSLNRPCKRSVCNGADALLVTFTKEEGKDWSTLYKIVDPIWDFAREHNCKIVDSAYNYRGGYERCGQGASSYRFCVMTKEN